MEYGQILEGKISQIEIEIERVERAIQVLESNNEYDSAIRILKTIIGELKGEIRKLDRKL